jgi:hypothetical protein
MRVDWAGGIEEKDLAKIYIGGEEFSGIAYQGLLTVNTKTYVDEPTRANDGSMPNIDEHDTFVVPRCKVNFKFFSIRDYQRLCRVINSANQFPVSYFDSQFGEFRTYMMYAEPEEMTRLYNVGTYVIGKLDFEISFIGTLNNLEKFNVRYITDGLTPRTINAYSNSMVYSLDNIVSSVDADNNTVYYKYINTTSSSGSPLTNTEYWKQIYKKIDKVENIIWGNSIKILTYSDLTDFYDIPTNKVFKEWNTRADGKGLKVLPNSIRWSVYENTNIYPILEDV